MTLSFNNFAQAQFEVSKDQQSFKFEALFKEDKDLKFKPP
jgi:hypothetical protein